MGMYSKKNGDRTVQWKLLEAFANSRGEIDWSSPFATDKLKALRYLVWKPGCKNDGFSAKEVLAAVKNASMGGK